MAVKFLDLDPINKPIGQIKLEGQEYDIYPLTVKNIINLSAAEKDVESLPLAKQVEMSIDIIQEVIKGVDRDVVARLNIQQLNALMTWLQSLGAEEAEKNSGPALVRKAKRR